MADNKVQKIDPYCDSVLGEWKPDKSKTKKGILAFTRSAELTIAKQYFQEWVDPKTFQKKRVYGKVVLHESKLLNAQTGDAAFHRSLDLTDDSVVESLDGKIEEREKEKDVIQEIEQKRKKETDVLKEIIKEQKKKERKKKKTNEY
jgi:hypothetical protein